MANCEINAERFAHDVCVHVLERYGIFKAPDDNRQQNKYAKNDFLPLASRGVVIAALWVRDNFKKTLEYEYETAEPSDKEKMWNFYDYHRLRDEEFEGRICTGKVCNSLALCTEYIQFVSTKGFNISLNKIVIGWGEYFDKHLKAEFEEKGGFSNMYDDLEVFKMDGLDKFLDGFISGYCLPYGVRECSTELLKMCKNKLGIPLDETISGVKTMCLVDYLIGRNSKKSRHNLSAREVQESDTSDSESSSKTTDSGENTDSEKSRGIGSEASDSETSQNNLLGIPPHEEMLREIDPFFVENIPLPPKPRSASRSPEGQPSSSDAPSALESAEDGAGSRDATATTSKLPEDGAGSSDAPPTASKLSEDKTGLSDAPPTASKLSEDGTGSSDAPPTASKLPEDGTGSSDAPPTASKLSEDGTGSSDAAPSASKSPEQEHDPSDSLRASPEEEDSEEQVEQILSRMEQDMEALRALLYRHGLLTTKSGRRGARMRTKDSKDTFPPKGPEGLI